LEHIPAKEIGDKEVAIQEVFDEIQNGPFNELRQPDVIKAFDLAKSKDFEVNVVATMSAGKSTLINSLLRQKLMPAKQEACTATITKIKDNDADCFMAKVYDKDGTLIQTHAELTYETMEQLNANPSVSRIQVEGNIPFVTADDVSLVLVDTPGPNNSRDPEHKAATYRMFKASCALYYECNTVSGE
jgi:GTPase Era involved in 16S rRNA processing